MAGVESRAHTLIPEQAVVLGCGMGGIAAAAALGNHFEQVVIVERDDLPEQPQARKGVPQDAQLHNLLTCAQANLESLLPGFLEDLQTAGAGNARVANETHVHELGIQMPERDLGLRLMSAWRPVIEHVARQRLLERSNITLRDATHADGLSVSRSRRLTGVIVSDKWGEETIETATIVDATGSGSPAKRWLEDHGRQVPRVDNKQVNQWYVSTIFDRPQSYAGLQDFWLAFPQYPETKGALISPVGDGLWYVSVSGQAADTPPQTPEEVMAYTHHLNDGDMVAATLDGASAVSEPHLFRKMNSSVRRYDLVDHPWPGVLAIGDSIASLNPLFGQGMSVAAQQAKELDTLLVDYQSGNLSKGELTSEYFDRALGFATRAWNLGEVVDQTIQGTATAPELAQRRFDGLATRIADDPLVHELYVKIWHLLEPPESLVPIMEQL